MKFCDGDEGERFYGFDDSFSFSGLIGMRGTNTPCSYVAVMVCGIVKILPIYEVTVTQRAV